ncbi:hypothetical protein BCLUESOX_659 [bacterium endosymbiont of Bathymodiolus sp. 5 South]|nr:hypothetical protein BCLUESOX_659 [bacterium endosymbiont of Bathymodiolus sp. 5 South]
MSIILLYRRFVIFFSRFMQRSQQFIQIPKTLTMKIKKICQQISFGL